MSLFKDSISETLSVVEELLRGLPPESRHRAKRAAILIENTLNAIKREAPNDPAAGLGVGFAIFKIAEQLIESSREAEKSGQGLIQLLS